MPTIRECEGGDHLVGGMVGKEKLRKRFEMLANGRWEELLRGSEATEEAASTARSRRRRRPVDAEDRRVSKAFGLVQMGELSAGRAILEATELAPGTDATLQQLQNLVRRPLRAQEPILEHLLTEMPVAPFELAERYTEHTLHPTAPNYTPHNTPAHRTTPCNAASHPRTSCGTLQHQTKRHTVVMQQTDFPS